MGNSKEEYNPGGEVIIDDFSPPLREHFDSLDDWVRAAAKWCGDAVDERVPDTG